MEEIMVYATKYQAPVGEITLACADNRLVGLWIAGQKYYGGTVTEQLIEKDNVEAFHQTKKWLDRYFAGGNPRLSELKLAPRGTEFQQQVWKILCEIPYGEVITYGDIAKKMAVMSGKKSMSSQAVGGAVGHNPISIIIPCHRVVGAKGNLTGYAGGIDKKKALLKHEGVDITQFIEPKEGTAL